MGRRTVHRCLLPAILAFVAAPCPGDEKVPLELRRWLTAQKWQRDTNGPIVSLGKRGDVDDTHIFAPAVAREKDQFMLWYCGSRGTVIERVFRLGLATSDDGKVFQKHRAGPVLDLGDNRRSVLTPTLLRTPDGTPLREHGKLRMWFTDVTRDPWVIRHATSLDGRRWRVTAEPVLELEQSWELRRLFYPTVLKIDGAYVMWYGNYWSARPSTTALGCAVSLDGMEWYLHPDNPILRPDPGRPWESNYVTSQSVARLADGSYRIWYASRKKPPFVNKYFAINTARWDGPDVRHKVDDRG